MASTSSRYAFNPEDKINWEELAPSLQDKFKGLWNRLNNDNKYLNDRIGDVRFTVGMKPPFDPIEYCELWFDTNIMALRAYVNGKWELTRGAWYGNSNSDVKSTTEGRLSSNQRTNCHCYNVKQAEIIGDGFCHCKMQLWNSDNVKVGDRSKLAFNDEITVAYSETTQYRWTIEPRGRGVTIQTLNAYTAENKQTNLILPTELQQRVEKNGEFVYFCSFNAKYDGMFDNSSSTTSVIGSKEIIPFEFAYKQKIGGVVGRLAAYSGGPVTITLEAYNTPNWIKLYSIDLPGNPQAYSVCHNHFPCRDFPW